MRAQGHLLYKNKPAGNIAHNHATFVLDQAERNEALDFSPRRLFWDLHEIRDRRYIRRGDIAV